MSYQRTSLIIPAYNEADRIGSVIEASLATTSLNDVIVINDGSTDTTSEVASGYDITVIDHSYNQGKGEALQSGVEFARKLGATTLVFLDADLHGLCTEHIDALANPVRSGEAIMTIGILERSLIQRSILRRWGAFSGQRALTFELWDQLSEAGRHGFGVEAALNATARQHKQHHLIERIEMRHVTHTGKREKESNIMRATSAYLKTYGAALGAYVRTELTKSYRSV